MSDQVGGVDISLSYKLQPKTRLYVELLNATNEPVYDFYEGDPCILTTTAFGHGRLTRA